MLTPTPPVYRTEQPSGGGVHHLPGFRWVQLFRHLGLAREKRRQHTGLRKAAIPEPSPPPSRTISKRSGLALPSATPRLTSMSPRSTRPWPPAKPTPMPTARHTMTKRRNDAHGYRATAEQLVGPYGGVSYMGVDQNSYSTSGNSGAGNGWKTDWVFTDGVGTGLACGQAAAHENGHGFIFLTKAITPAARWSTSIARATTTVATARMPRSSAPPITRNAALAAGRLRQRQFQPHPERPCRDS